MNWAVLFVVAAVGCRAEVNQAADLSGVDFAVAADLSMPDLSTPVDYGPPDLRCSGPVGPEDCNNGCDDDHNGYTDGDDPVCTPSVLVTTQGGTATLNRLVFGSTLATKVVDGNPVPANMFAVHIRGFDPGVFIAHENSPAYLRKLTLSSTGTGTTADFFTSWSNARDACIFNGEVLVLSRGNGMTTLSKIHRFASDGMTEIAAVSIGTVNTDASFATSCASDGTSLFVADHDILFNPSQFRVFDKTLTEKKPAIPVPAALVALGRDRILDFAWTSRGFYGLFTDGTASVNDSTLNANQIFPFDMGGGVGAPIDAGIVHGIGTFAP